MSVTRGGLSGIPILRPLALEQKLTRRLTAAMSLEALQIQMDTLKREMGQLEIENRRLREGNPDQEKLLELEGRS